jgi:tetratricopeptide (TPR) repeat protein
MVRARPLLAAWAASWCLLGGFVATTRGAEDERWRDLLSAYQAQMQAQSYELAGATAEAMVRLAEGSADDNPHRLAIGLCGLGDVRQRQHRTAEAEMLYLRSIWLMEQKDEAQHDVLVKPLFELSGIALAQQRLEDAEAFAQRGMAVAAAQSGGDEAELEVWWFRLGEIAAHRHAYATAVERFQQALGIAERTHGVAHHDVARSAEQLGETYLAARSYGAAEAPLLRALQVFQTEPAQYYNAIADLQVSLARVWNVAGATAEAEDALRAGLRMYDELAGEVDGDFTLGKIQLRQELALLYLGQDRYAEAHALCAGNRELAQQVPDIERRFRVCNVEQLVHFEHLRRRTYLEAPLADDEPPQELLERLKRQYVLHSEAGRNLEAEAAARQMVALAERLDQPQPQMEATARTYLAHPLVFQGRTAEAVAEHRAALALLTVLWPPDDPRLVPFLSNAALVAVKAGQSRYAHELYERGLAIVAKAPEGSPADAAYLHQAQGLLLLQEFRYAEAVQTFERCLEAGARSAAADSDFAANALHALGYAYEGVGRVEEAEAMLRRSLELYRQLHGGDCAESALVLNTLGALYADSGTSAKAEAAYLESIAVTERHAGPDSLALLPVLENLARMHVRNQAYDRAEAICQRMRDVAAQHPAGTAGKGPPTVEELVRRERERQATKAAEP